MTIFLVNECSFSKCINQIMNLKVRSLLHSTGQFSKIGWKMVMCGDETWLKLFPGLFMRHDGVNSFFVSIIPESFDITRKGRCLVQYMHFIPLRVEGVAIRD